LRLRTVTEPFSFGQVFELIPLGDSHLGSANCDIKALRKWVKRVEDNPDARWVGMGDLVESIAPDDPRWNPKDVDPAISLDDQAEIAIWYADKILEIFGSIMDKCWSLNDGNHEDKFNAKYHCNLYKSVCRQAGIPLGENQLYQEWASGTRIVFEDKHQHRRSLKIYQQHGWQSGRKDGAKINGLDDLIACHTGYDIYLVAHSHSRLLKTKASLTANNTFDDLEVPEVYAAHTASFLRTYQLNKVGYGEKKAYPATSIKPVRFTLTPTRDNGVEIEGTL
jgi:hypothetical protein